MRRRITFLFLILNSVQMLTGCVGISSHRSESLVEFVPPATDSQLMPVSQPVPGGINEPIRFDLTAGLGGSLLVAPFGEADFVDPGTGFNLELGIRPIAAPPMGFIRYEVASVDETSDGRSTRYSIVSGGARRVRFKRTESNFIPTFGYGLSYHHFSRPSDPGLDAAGPFGMLELTWIPSGEPGTPPPRYAIGLELQVHLWASENNKFGGMAGVTLGLTFW